MTGRSAAYSVSVTKAESFGTRTRSKPAKPGVTKAEVKEAKNQYDIAKLNLLKNKEDIDLSLRQSYYNMREAEKRFEGIGRHQVGPGIGSIGDLLLIAWRGGHEKRT